MRKSKNVKQAFSKMRGFNGAARFCVRKFDLHRPLGLTDFQLQWGRTFLRAEIEEMIYQAYREAGGFNGAARFCVRKFGS